MLLTMIPVVRHHLGGCLALLLGALLTIPLVGWAERSEGFSEGAYFFENWPAAEGTDLNAVTALWQAHDGYLWLGTYNGLFRFDGVRLVMSGAHGAQRLTNRRITALFEDQTGTLWMGHENGEISRYSKGEFRVEKLPFNWVGGAIETIKADEHGDIWLGSTRGGAFRLRDGQCSLLDLADKGWPVWMANDQRGALWVMSNGTVGQLRDGVFQGLELDAGRHDTNNYERLVPARDGGFWVQRNGKLGKWRAGGWALAPRPVPWHNDHTTTESLESASGSLLVGTMRSGLFIFSPAGEVSHFTRHDGLLSDQIRSICQDHEGNIWLGTGDGLSAMRPRKVRMLIAPDDWQGYKVLSFAAHADGSVWVGTQGAGLYHFADGGWSALDGANGLPSMFVWSILERSDGELLVGSWDKGTVSGRGDRLTAPSELARAEGSALAMYEAADGRLWIGNQRGLGCWAGGKLTWVVGKQDFKVPDVRAITAGPDGTIWFGMLGSGLGSLQSGRIQHFGRAEGLASDFVQAVLAEADGTIWVGTSDQGLACGRNGKFTTIGVDQGLPSDSVSRILDDEAGHLWLGSQRGIARVSKAELELCAVGKLSTVQCLNYGRAEGLASQTCSGGFQPGACRTPDGRLWFSTVKGIAIIDPRVATTNLTAPPVVIEEFKVEGLPVGEVGTADPGTESAEGWRIPAGKQRFDFVWTGLSFAAPERVRFRYQLAGLETGWVEAGAQRSVQYSYLRPGAYTFRVTACNNDSVWNEAGASLRFRVLPHFWQTWWFRGLAVTGGAGLVGGGAWLTARRRAGRKLELLRRQQAVERERARIARDIHDDLGASLTRITMLSHTVRAELQDNSRGARAAGEVNRTARELTRSLDEIVWAVNPRHDRLESLANYLGGYAQDFLSTAGIACRLDLPIALPDLTLTADFRHNVFLAFKEALNNVVKHAGATEVTVSLEFQADGFLLLIADDGRGFDPVTPPAEGPGRRHGLANMVQRMAEIGGDCQWEAAPGGGTRVKLRVRFPA